MRFNLRPRGTGLAVVTILAAAVSAATAMYALAGHEPTSVASYTGCLSTAKGTLSRFAAGNSPQSPCPLGNVPIHVSGGDITGVNAGTGLTGTAAQGTANLSVNFSDFGTCPAGSAIRVIGMTATCEADDDTTYSAGAGLNLSGTTFSVDTSAIQARVGGTCTVGSAVREVNANGTVTCEPIPAAGPGIPSGAVMSFDLTSCPSGWSALTAGQGRYKIGRASCRERV